MKLGSLLPVLKTLFRMRCCWLGVEAQFKGQLSLTQAHRVSSRRSALTVEGINIIECQRRAANGAEQHGAGAASCSDDDGASLKNYHHRRFAGTEAAAGRRDRWFADGWRGCLCATPLEVVGGEVPPPALIPPFSLPH